jgi:hypothetical protein
VDLPIGPSEPSSRDVDSYSAVDDRDQMAVRSEIQSRAGPGPIYTREQNVAVERGSPTIFLDDAVLEGLDLRFAGSCPAPETAGEHLDLGTDQPHIAFAGVQKAVEVCSFTESKSIRSISAMPVRASASAMRDPTLPAPMIPTRKRESCCWADSPQADTVRSSCAVTSGGGRNASFQVTVRAAGLIVVPTAPTGPGTLRPSNPFGEGVD